MANNFQVNVYFINQGPYPPGYGTSTGTGSIRIGFPTAGVSIKDVSGSPQRGATGYSLYCLITTIADGQLYYVTETFAQIATLIG
jgi:hypothetical protein